MGHSYNYYDNILAPIVWIPMGAGFVFILAGWFLLKFLSKEITEEIPNKDSVLNVKMKKNIPECCYSKKEDRCSLLFCYCCCSKSPFCTCTCHKKKFLATLGELNLQMTIFTSQFLFGATSVELKDKIWYTQRCIKIGRRYFKLSAWSLVPLVMYNVTTITILLIFTIVFAALQTTDKCDQSLDCFLDDVNNHAKITNCSEYKDGEVIVICYKVSFQPLLVISFLGGFLRIVPPFVFKLTTAIYLVLLRHQPLWLKIIINILQSIVIFGCLILVISINAINTEKQIYQFVTTYLLFGIFLCFPWYYIDIKKIGEKVILMQADVKTKDINSDNTERENLIPGEREMSHHENNAE